MRIPILIGTTATAFALAGCIHLDDSAALTQSQREAIDAALTNVQAILDTNEAAAASLDDENNALAAKQAQNAQQTFGTCPQVTVSGLLQPNVPTTVTTDFGDGCTPIGTMLSCTGGATGTLAFNPNTLDLTFVTFGCDVRMIDGTTSQTWQRANGVLILSGDWNLAVNSTELGATAIDANGAMAVDRNTLTTTIESLTGAITVSGATWTVGANTLLISYAANANLVPASGVLTVTGPTGDSLAITFDSNSPITGEVRVSINGGPQIPYTLAIFDDAA